LQLLLGLNQNKVYILQLLPELLLLCLVAVAFKLQDQQAHLLYSERDLIYATPCINGRIGDFFDIYRLGKDYFHPITKEFLGYFSFKVGDARVEDRKLWALEVTESLTALKADMRLLPLQTQDIFLKHDFVPRRFPCPVQGYILDAWEEGSFLFGQNEVVLISLGCREGVRIGDVFDIYQSPRDLNGRLKSAIENRKKAWREDNPPGSAERPRIGRLLVFQVEHKLSMALIRESYRDIKLMDQVLNP